MGLAFKIRVRFSVKIRVRFSARIRVRFSVSDKGVFGCCVRS